MVSFSTYKSPYINPVTGFDYNFYRIFNGYYEIRPFQIIFLSEVALEIETDRVRKLNFYRSIPHCE